MSQMSHFLHFFYWTLALANILGQEPSLTHYSLSSPLFDPPPPVSLPTSLAHLTPGSTAHVQNQDSLLDNSNLCDILMLERALETEAVLGGGGGGLGSFGSAPTIGGENKVDMLEIPGKGRCYVYLAR